MRALVLSGGSGTRLRPITHTAAKQLVPIANKPVLFYGLESIAASGIKEVGIVVGKTADEIQRAVGDGGKFGLEVTYIKQEYPSGLAHAVLIARDFLGDDDFVMYLGDNFIRGGISGFVNDFARRDPSIAAQILLAQVPDPSRFGVAVIGEDGSVVGLVEKPQTPPSDLALVGVYMFDKHIHDAVRSIAPSARGELEITDAISKLIDDGYKVSTSKVEGYWKDLGEPDALLEGNRIALMGIDPEIAGEVVGSRIDGPVIVGKGAKIVDSVIRGPAVIGEGTEVANSFVGPFTAIGANSVIESTEISNSIVLEECRVEGVIGLESSIIGKYAKVVKRTRRPSANCLVIGDHSQVELL
jgi:glucose-1-phosphate thymidylyltransferase